MSEAIKAAEDELEALCQGKKFRMCVPVQETDSDIVIQAGLNAGKEAIARAEKAEADAARLAELVKNQQIATSVYFKYDGDQHGDAYGKALDKILDSMDAIDAALAEIEALKGGEG